MKFFRTFTRESFNRKTNVKTPLKTVKRFTFRFRYLSPFLNRENFTGKLNVLRAGVLIVSVYYGNRDGFRVSLTPTPHQSIHSKSDSDFSEKSPETEGTHVKFFNQLLTKKLLFYPIFRPNLRLSPYVGR